ncbi:hypothetical protein L1987_52616 [Smallanthus sonchifolius]|uniref:Uncharacterized protein n=1 Tax=Smallanthus sonchifolius TaxID=185202 RepID=A0ACB9EUT8_9ASTR|nr:hypothetical protein L1987_52616 [Smallanthus sonchifolius]
MIRREKKGPSSRDLLVCFPTRAHLALMPKPACSPRRHLHLNYQNHLRKSMRGGGGGNGGGHASPYMWSGTKQMSSDNLSEPTSPKVTCVGQIKVRPSTRPCKNWQTVMEEIERIHNNRKKKPTWMETLGFKKEVMQFLTCLRNIKFDFRCLGAFSHVDITSDDEEDGEDNNDKGINQIQDHHEHDRDINQEVSSQTMFSKWFMVLQENQDCEILEKDEKSLKSKETEDHHPCMPPTNALLLMRCRSAPAKSWMEEKEEEEEQQKKYGDDNDHDHDKEDEEHGDKDQKVEQKEIKRKSLSELMKNEGDFYKLSIDVAKETWVIGGIHKDPFSRSRSWRR